MIPSIIGLAELAKMSFDGADFAPLWQELTARFGADSADPDAHGRMCAALMDMCVIDQMRGDPERGLVFQVQALTMCRLYQISAERQPATLTVLGFVIAGKINANTPVEFLLEGSEVTLHLLYVVPGQPLPPVPEHDVAVVLVADSEAAKPALCELERLLEWWPRPVLNPPHLIPRVGRDCLYRLLAPIQGVVIPATVQVSRADLSVAPSDCDYPLIVRPVDSHAGDGLEKITDANELTAYLATHLEDAFYLSSFQDYRSADGLYRKYRVMVIDGQAFPCHLAVSQHWMIHYLNAGMAESAEKRREEEQFLNCFDTEFGHRHGRVLTEIAETLGLDYFGIDCAEMPDGRLLIFEASTALVVHDMDPPDLYPYKGRPMRSLFAAFQSLLYRRAEGEAIVTGSAGADPNRR